MHPSIAQDSLGSCEYIVQRSDHWKISVLFLLNDDIPPQHKALVVKFEEVFCDILEIRNGLCNLFHEENQCCVRTRRVAISVRTFLLLMGQPPASFPRTDGVPDMSDYHELRFLFQEVMRRCWASYMSDGLERMPRPILDLLTANNMYVLDEHVDEFHFDHWPRHIIHHIPSDATEMRWWLLEAKSISDVGIPEVGTPRPIQRNPLHQYATSNFLIQPQRQMIYIPTFERISGVQIFTLGISKQILRWGLPHPQYMTMRESRFVGDVIEFSLPSSMTVNSGSRWAAGALYSMGDHVPRQMSVLILTIRRNLECLVRMGHRLRMGVFAHMPEPKQRELQLCFEYCLHGCQMIIAGYSVLPSSVQSSPKLQMLISVIRSEVCSVYIRNSELLSERVPSTLMKLVREVIDHGRTSTFDVSQVLVNGEWIDNLDSSQTNLFLEICGYTHPSLPNLYPDSCWELCFFDD